MIKAYHLFVTCNGRHCSQLPAYMCSALFSLERALLYCCCSLACNVCNEKSIFPAIVVPGYSVMKQQPSGQSFGENTQGDTIGQCTPFGPPLGPSWNMCPTLVVGCEVEAKLSWSFQAAITKYHRWGGSRIAEIYCSQF